jgi:hypothetical protein
VISLVFLWHWDKNPRDKWVRLQAKARRSMAVSCKLMSASATNEVQSIPLCPPLKTR